MESPANREAVELLPIGSAGAEIEDEAALVAELLDAAVVAVDNPRVAAGVGAQSVRKTASAAL
jgi:hypothetical protein